MTVVMNIERFHNELAMRLGYERIVKDKRILISVEESDEPWVTLKVEGFDDIRFNASSKTTEVDFTASPEIKNKIELIIDAMHQAYKTTINSLF